MTEHDQRSDEQHDGRTRLLAAAIELIAHEGHRAATVRRVAEAAGVSAPLVLHHFGSKAGLVEACDHEVRAAVDEVIERVATAGGDRSMHHLLADPHAAIALMYIGRALQDDAEMGRAWFDDLYRRTQTAMTEMEAAGVTRPVDDRPMTAALLLAMDLGMVLLRPHVERIVDGELADPETTRRWLTAEFDLFTRPLLLTPHDPAPETT